MTFAPVVAGSGLVAWRFLTRTYDAQIDTYARSPAVTRDTGYFLEKITEVSTAADLVADRRLLQVALGAFGLQDDIDDRYFVRKILEDGTTSDDALAIRLTDQRYRDLSDAFGFGPGQSPNTGDIGAMTDLADRFRVQMFEAAVGEQDNDMRVALYAQRELAELAADAVSEETKWYTLMSLPPLRNMFETALSLPSSFGQLDIEKQMEILRDKTAGVLGDNTVSQFSDPQKLSDFTDRFLMQAQIRDARQAASPQAVALSLLRANQA
ncbi:DUF1217 domain-containing protein [Pukyongiella litopenaei]|uniref:DUF1217 domain-containing protein n=1 Tax=Pukyongiella litopenaei TaxID=2605946 RepID=A0A2S0MS29_9RHOB|nr:DUF1217 domain-containing protein [Pukyongiella litopenaei]AVO38551.1 DUF1217 domain-containing protein [Pukyongiella litopenaei]